MICTVTIGFWHLASLAIVGAVGLFAGMMIGSNSRTRGEQ